MSKKYKGVFRDSKGRIYCQTEFRATATGKGNDSSGIVICGVSLFEVRKKPMTSYVE